MSRKPTKGYFVKGQFVAEGSELDIALKAELKGTTESSRTDLKRESDALQKLGAELLEFGPNWLARQPIPEKLMEALTEARRITNFEGKRRQMQYVGKLMRKLDESTIDALRAALEEQRKGPAAEKLALHQAEQWRDRLIADDAAVQDFIDQYPGIEIQPLRALIRQARKDAAPAGKVANVAASQGLAPRKGRAYRELFQLVREHLNPSSTDAHPLPAHNADEDFED